jgi:hypothetical protein
MRTLLTTLIILFTPNIHAFYNAENNSNPVDFFYDNYDEEIEELPEEDKKQTIFYKNKPMGQESLVIVQSISNTKKTLVIRKGRKDFLSPGMQALISTDKISILAQAKQVSRFYSIWEVADPDVSFPFKVKDYVVFNSSTVSLFDQIPSLQKRLNAELKRINYVAPANWVIRGVGTLGIYESVSDTGSSLVEDRLGAQVSIFRYSHLANRLEVGFGLRVDLERAVLKSTPRLEIPTNRYLFLTELIYHFPYLKTKATHFYGGIGLGAGISQTSVSESISTGLAVAIPVMRLGLETKVSQKRSFLVEGVAEGVSMRESFEDGTEQNTNIANLKISIGLKF